MSVITTLISKYCTAHATDSLISKIQSDGTVVNEEWEQSKIIPVPELRGAMSYFGLATHGAYNWSTYHWLRKQAVNRGSATTASDFAEKLRNDLSDEIANMKFNDPRDPGIGIHFSAYEYVDERLVPELFWISNWEDPSYSSVSRKGVCLSRETYHIVKGRSTDRMGDPQKRLEVYRYLHGGGIIWFNNGDPLMFNPAANTILKLMQVSLERHKIKDLSDIQIWTALATLPVRVVSDIQRHFYRKNLRIVGGKIHDFVMKPNGEYTSTPGDI